MKHIYMDHAATTRVSERAFQAMLPYFREEYGNPSAIYSYGQTGKNAVEKCRDHIAKAIGALRTEIYFTSGGTESDNWVIQSICRSKKAKGNHIVSTAIEHNAVKKTLAAMEAEGFEVTYLNPDQYGQISAEQLENAIRKDTILVTIMLANNVVGTILNIKELAKTAHKHHIPFHTDAVQAVGHIPVNVRDLGVDFLSVSAHKFNGPKGVGALFCRLPYHLKPLLLGGGQEKDGRSGTENVPGIVGMAEALKEAVEQLPQNMEYLEDLRTYLMDGVKRIPGVHITGDETNRLPGFCSFVVENIPHSVLLVNAMNEKGVCISSGSACSASSKEASHVLLALGYDKQLANCSLRITLGMDNSKDDVEYVVQALTEAITAIRTEQVSLAPRLEGRVKEV